MIRVVFLLSFIFCYASLSIYGRMSNMSPAWNEARADSSEQALIMWRKALEAKGGENVLNRIENLLVSSRAEYPLPRKGFEGVSNHLQALFVFPMKYFQWADDRPSKLGLALWVYNADRDAYWLTYENDPESPRKLELRYGAYEIIRWQIIAFMQTTWVKPLPVELTTEKVAGVETDVVRTRYDTYDVEYFLDRNSHLPIRIRILGIAQDGKKREFDSVILGEYQMKDGIQFPRRMGFFSEEGEVDSRLVYEFKVNVEYDDQVFTKPPTAGGGPEAWKRRL